MTEVQFESWCRSLNLSRTAIAVIQNIRQSPPSRRPQSTAFSISGTYPSVKMGCTISSESNSNELLAIYKMEHDPDVLEFYEQPPKIRLKYVSATGRNVSVDSTPDFFVLRTEGAGWEEWKQIEALPKLSEEMPERFVLSEEKNWICPPGQRFAEEYGLTYCIRTSAEHNPVFARNMVFLHEYYSSQKSTIPKKAEEEVKCIVGSRPSITLTDLKGLVETATVDHIHFLIARDCVFVDLDSDLLTEPEKVEVFIDAEAAETWREATSRLIRAPHVESPVFFLELGAILEWNERTFKIVNHSERVVCLVSEDAKIIEIPRAELNNFAAKGTITCFPAASIRHSRSGAQKTLAAHNFHSQAEPRAGHEVAVVAMAGPTGLVRDVALPEPTS